MTARMRAQLIAWAQLVGAATVITGVASSVLSAIVAISFQLWGAQILRSAGVATSEEVGAMKEQVDDLLRRVTVLARPNEIAHYRDLPKTLMPTCAAGQECVILVFAERDMRARECEILPDETRLRIRQEGREYQIPPSNSENAVNLSTSPQATEPTFVLPRSLEPGLVSATLTTHYTNCLWQVNGDPPATQDSPEFRIHIRGAQR